MERPFNRRKFYRFRSRMILVMVLVMIAIVTVMVLLHDLNTRMVNQHVVDTTTELLNIIQIAETKIPADDPPQAAVEKYVQELEQHGVSAVRVVDASGSNSIIASTNPKEVGKRITPKRESKRKGPFRVYGRVGEDDQSTQEPYRITFPVIQGEEVIGYSVLDMPLDDFQKLLNRLYFERILATVAILLLGGISIVYLAFRFTRPIDTLVEAAHQVAAGNLGFSIPIKEKDEIGTLSATFNEMIEKLRESKKLEERLYQVEKQSTVGRLASGIAHEIRNPLNYINLSIDYVKSKFEPEDRTKAQEYQKTLDNIKDEISRLKKMVSDFLEYGKPTKLALRAWPLRPLISDVVNLLSRKIEDQQIELRTEFPRNEACIVADQEQIKTCLMNILINSVESMPTGGTLTILAKEDMERQVVSLTVSDSGEGIAQEVQGSVFEPYFSTKETGVGLGLAITKKIINDHGGKIWLESELGRGTRVHVELPLAMEAALAGAEP
ncbi:MAG: ATP-binding protein [Acidobacteriia bacterium]|nr:ATP-binding protein [Terriglobia bacterium]